MDWLGGAEAMKTAGGRKPKPLSHSAQQPSEWRGRSEQISLDQVGCEARKIQVAESIQYECIERTQKEVPDFERGSAITFCTKGRTH